ncbi:protein phosphatase 1 regulatory subunit 14B-like [Asterias rubens]|uniref:protein phosphatase 1 regulatory subunit 14B-like n=1 Tax=Asterias rubens TaxID=7604 RepID=UPI00145554B5|nr:protein phosphatase 1 regulatory subunit 14B-like [Asterias rubens]
MATTGESRRPNSTGQPPLVKTSSQDAARKVSMELNSSSKPMSPDDKTKKRNIHVTAKYNRKQMRLRLNIEEWMDGQLRILYECEEDEDYPVEIDIDALLEEGEGLNRYKFVADIISDVRKPKETFIKELLQKIEVL